jgi:hypothetical protein
MLAEGDDGVPTLDTTMAVEAMASSVTSGAAASDPAALTGPMAGALPYPPCTAAATTSTGTDDNIIQELEVDMGHPGLRALGTFALSEVMGTTHFPRN